MRAGEAASPRVIADVPPRRGRAPEARDLEAPASELAAFRPEPAILSPPTSAAPVVGSGAAHAEVAALADRLLDSMRLGRRADGSHEVRLQLSRGSRYDDLEVHLVDDGDGLRAVVQTPAGAGGRGRALARAIEREFEALGRDVASVSVEES